MALGGVKIYETQSGALKKNTIIEKQAVASRHLPAFLSLNWGSYLTPTALFQVHTSLLTFAINNNIKNLCNFALKVH